VHALETVHTALRPNGLLLDIRPAQQQPWLEVSPAEICTHLGQIDDTYRMSTLAMADAAVETVREGGLFEREEDITFPFIYHCGDVDAWLAYMADHWSSATVDDTLIECAREALREDPGDLRIHRIVHAARLRRGDSRTTVETLGHSQIGLPANVRANALNQRCPPGRGHPCGQETTRWPTLFTQGPQEFKGALG